MICDFIGEMSRLELWSLWIAVVLTALGIAWRILPNLRAEEAGIPTLDRPISSRRDWAMGEHDGTSMAEYNDLTDSYENEGKN